MSALEKNQARSGSGDMLCEEGVQGKVAMLRTPACGEQRTHTPEMAISFQKEKGERTELIVHSFSFPHHQREKCNFHRNKNER